MNDDDIKSLIRRRRRQILVHSCLYYRLNESIVPDHVYDGWALQLAVLHENFPEEASEVEYHEYFQGFTGETVSGFDLPVHLPEIIAIAHSLLKYHKQLKASTKR
jgi:NAD-dependent DNA ligase